QRPVACGDVGARTAVVGHGVPEQPGELARDRVPAEDVFVAAALEHCDTGRAHVPQIRDGFDDFLQDAARIRPQFVSERGKHVRLGAVTGTARRAGYAVLV